MERRGAELVKGLGSLSNTLLKKMKTLSWGKNRGGGEKAMSQAFHLQGGCHGVKIVGVGPEDRTGTSSSRGHVVVTSYLECQEVNRCPLRKGARVK